MNHHRAKMFWIIGLIITAISLGLLWFGVRMILEQSLDMQNIFAYILMSITFGGLAGAFYALEMKAAFTLFVTGLIVGYFSMFWKFIVGMDGWGDLTGVLSLFIYAGIGLAVGLIVQLIWYIIRRIRNKDY